MRVLMLAPLPPPSGGIASWTVRYKDFCKEQGISLDIINIAMIGNRASVETMKRSFIDEVTRTRTILHEEKKKIREKRYDVIHINTACSKYGVLRDLACGIIAAGKLPIVVHCRCNIEDQLKGRIAHLAFNKLVNKASAVIVLNSFSKKYVDCISAGKTVYIPNFVNEKMISNKHNVRENIKNIITVGHVEEEKGLSIILETANHFASYKFILVGAIREDISSLKIPSNVVLTGRKKQEEVQSYLEDADVFLFPTKTEGFSNALVEAMAKGLPVIASDVGANKEMIENKGGIIVEKNDQQHICEAMEKLIPYEIRENMSAWNIAKVRNNYLITTVMNQYFDLYQKIMEL